MRKLKTVVVNVTLVLCGLAVGYFAASLIFFRVALLYLAPEARYLLPDTAEVLAQTSKAGLQPRDYVALLGDSYAVGVGDWMLAPNASSRDELHSAGVIRKLTGMDIVSFGRPGAGSAEAMTQRSAAIFAGRECPLFPHLEDPKYLVVYFYEGNDLLDNIGLFWGIGGDAAHIDTVALDNFLATQYGAIPNLNCYGSLFSTAIRMVKLLVGRGVLLPRFPPDRNAFVVADKPTAAPGLLQGPSLELSEQEMRAAAVIFDRSLMWLRQKFPRGKMLVVYIPSPLSVYTPAADFVSSVSYTGAARNYPSELVKQHSDLSCDLIRQYTVGRQAAFLDAREVLREAAESEFIHGPRDWNHLNEAGYQVLGMFVADRIQHGANESMACGG